MFRSILAVLLGVVAGGVATGLLEYAGHVLLPLPDGVVLDPERPQTFRDVPDINRLAVVLAWGGAAVVAGFVTALVAGQRHVFLALITGGGLLFAGLTNLILIPSPFWMWVFGLTIFLPAAWLGARLAPRGGGA
ncbi:hypothetical protein [Maricaulis sp. CAU 1757]